MSGSIRGDSARWSTSHGAKMVATLAFKARTFLAAAALVLGTAGADAQSIGFVWDDQPTTPGTTSPNPFYAYNSSGGAVSIARNSPGNYSVTFSGLANTSVSDVMVTAYGSNSIYCQIGNWSSSGADEDASVFCFSPTGARKDSAFTLLYQARSSSDKDRPTLAFLWANQPTAANYTPSGSYQYNTIGGANTIVRNGVGNYTVFVPGITPAGGTVLVTAYGSTAAHCATDSWVPNPSGTDIYVFCRDTHGAALDAQFDLVYSIGRTAGFSNGSKLGAAIWADNDLRTAPYTPPKPFDIRMGKSPMTSQRTANGKYLWTIPVTDSWAAETALVTVYGAESGNYCKSSGFTDSFTTSGESQVYIDCFDAAGKPVNTDFTATYQTAGTQ